MALAVVMFAVWALIRHADVTELEKANVAAAARIKSLESKVSELDAKVSLIREEQTRNAAPVKDLRKDLSK